MRAAAYVTAAVVDTLRHGADSEQRAAAAARTALLTPIIKGWLTEVAQELTSLGVQVHGGMGYVEETGAAQHMRDARILTIYEGTTGIQANDLVGRKILFDEGKAMREWIDEMRSMDAELAAAVDLTPIREALSSALDDLEAAVRWLLENAPGDQNAPGAASVNLLMLAGTVAGGWQMARAALAAKKRLADDDTDTTFLESKIMTALFYAAHILPRSSSYCQAAVSGSDVIMTMPETSF
jgi:hypothetical protein